MADPPQSEVADEFDDADSALGEDDEDLSSTASIGSSILRYRQENGRTYHAYKDGKYLLPNDEVRFRSQSSLAAWCLLCGT